MGARAQCLAVHCAQTTATGTRVHAVIDVVVVAFQSSAHLRLCVEPLAGEHDLNVVVVDNACPERSTESLAELNIAVVRMGRNAGFASAANAGAARGTADAVLFLNPDAFITP